MCIEIAAQVIDFDFRKGIDRDFARLGFGLLEGCFKFFDGRDVFGGRIEIQFSISRCRYDANDCRKGKASCVFRV